MSTKRLPIIAIGALAGAVGETSSLRASSTVNKMNAQKYAAGSHALQNDDREYGEKRG
jgi:hypothetical protein